MDTVSADFTAFIKGLAACRPGGFTDFIDDAQRQGSLTSENAAWAIVSAAARKQGGESIPLNAITEIFERGPKDPKTFIAALKFCPLDCFDKILEITRDARWTPDSATTQEAFAIAAIRTYEAQETLGTKNLPLQGAVARVFQIGAQNSDTFLKALETYCNRVNIYSCDTYRVINTLRDTKYIPDPQTTVQAIEIIAKDYRDAGGNDLNQRDASIRNLLERSIDGSKDPLTTVCTMALIAESSELSDPEKAALGMHLFRETPSQASFLKALKLTKDPESFNKIINVAAADKNLSLDEPTLKEAIRIADTLGFQGVLNKLRER